MKNSTYKKLNYIKITIFVFLLFTSFHSKAQLSYSESYKNSFTTQLGIKATNSSTCDGEMQTILKDDFGSGVSDRGPKPTDFTTSYNFSSSGGIGPNGFGVMKNANQVNNSWSSGGDHTTGKNGNGYMLVFDANSILGSVFYEKKYSGLCSGNLCTFSIYAANLISTTYQSPYAVNPMIKIDLINPLNGQILKSFTSTQLQRSQQNELLWNELSLEFNIPIGVESVILRVSNAQTNTNTDGNDVAFDDASFSICVAPLTISTSNSKICTGDSVRLSAANNSSTGTSYSYQWQQASGSNWTDISGATSLYFQTPPLAQTTTYRIRYAQAGVDISNNNNLMCSGSKDILIEVDPKPNTITTSKTICFGETYTWTQNNKEYITSGTYTINNDNCTADQILNLTVLPALPVTSISYLESIYTKVSGTASINLTGQTGGKFTAFPAGLSIDENTGTINLGNSLENAYTVTYTYSNGNCIGTTNTNVKIQAPQLAVWLVAKDANNNGIVEPGETITFILRASNLNPDYKTLKNITGSIDLPAHTTLVGDPQFVTPSNNTFSNNGDYPYLWDLSYQRDPAIVMTVKADCDLTGVTQIGTIGRLYIDGVETKTSVPPIPISSVGTWVGVFNNSKYLNPPDLENCTNPQGCTSALPVASMNVSVLNINNPAAVCAGNAINLATTVSADSTPGTLTYWTDAAATTPLVNPTAVATTGTYFIKNTSLQGCEVIKPVIVNILGKINASITQKDVKCKGENTGSVIITPNGGTSPYSITPAQTGLRAGLHTFTIKDANDCIITVDVTILEPADVLTATASNIINVLRKGDATGSVLITATGGTAPYTIPVTTGLYAGKHTFTVTDANGCTTDVEVNITEPDMELSGTITKQLNLICNSDASGSVEITPSGGTAPYKITPIQTGLSAGSHTFTIKDSNNVTFDIVATLTQPEVLTAAAANQINVSCNGMANGSVVVTATGGTAPYTIAVTTGLNAGKHTFTVTDANRCTADVEVNITEPQALTAIAANQINVSCNGLANGSVVVTAAGGTAPYTIPTTTGLNAGKHTFTVTDANGCTTDVEVNITEPQALTAIAANQINVLRKGDATGSVVITATGGTAPYTIPVTTELYAGKHTFTVTDANGCTTDVEVNITEPDMELSGTITKQLNLICNSDASGSVEITPSGGTAPYKITPIQTGLSAGSHTFTIKDSNNVTFDIVATLTQPEVLTAAAANQINVSCNGMANGSVEVTATGGTAPYTIPVTTGLNAGKHTFTVTDANRCTADVEVNITEPQALTAIAANQINVSCNGLANGSVVITAAGGTAPYTIPTTTGLNAGKHTFTVTDANGCAADMEVNITEPQVLTAVSANQINVSCNGLANGSVVITAAGGTAPYTIPTTTGLNAGKHTFTVTDANGCTADMEVNITEPQVLTAVSANQINVSCNGLANGSVVITAAGGTAPYTIPTTTGLNAGKHTFTVTDANGCTTDVEVNITEPQALTAIAANQINVSCNGLANGSVIITAAGGIAPYTIPVTTGLNAGKHTFTVTDANGCTTDVEVNITEPQVLTAVSANQINVSCNGLANGSVVITAAGGTAPYTIPTTTGLNAGKHTFTVTDATGCATDVEVNITEPQALTAIAANQINVSCNGLANGSVVVTATGGTAPYTIPTTTGLNAGKHTFTVTDANGCTADMEVNITEPQVLTAVSANQINVSCNGLANGSVVITAAGGTAPYTIPTTTGLNAGKHTFTVTDANGCTTDVEVNITEPQALTAIAANQINVSCNGLANGSVIITAAGGIAPYTIPVTTGLNAGKHTFTVTDANGCTTDVEVNITEPQVLTAVSANQINVSCNGLANGSVIITAAGGIAPYTIPVTTGLNAGKHTFTVTDANGCTTDVEVNITEPQVLTAVSANQINVSCNGLANGSVVITAAGGTAPYTIPVTTGLNAGKHTFTVTDANGCATDVEVNITEPQALTAIAANQINVSCNGLANGSVVITAAGGTAPYTIPVTTGLNAGKHTFTVTDANGCATDVEVNITEPQALTAIAANQINVSCNGLANGSVVVTAAGGTAPYTIPTTTGLNAGKHTFTVTDANGCTADVEVIILQPDKVAAKVIEPIIQEFCDGDKDGSFKIEIVGGTTPYNVTLDNINGIYEQTTGHEHTFINLTGGLHIVFVKDANGCTTTLEVTMADAVRINPVIEINYGCLDNAHANSVTVNIDASITNLADVDYALDGSTYQLANVFTNISPGIHTITARHLTGCEQTSKSFVIDQINPLTLTLADGELNEIIATANGGSSNYQYTFEGESGNKLNKLIIYKSGTYTVTVTDSKGCTATATKYFQYIDVCISNYFTPNGDGVNDTWGPDCTINYKDLTFAIFDRYGRTIGTYKLGQKWDGKYNGTELTSGDYWYVLKLNDPKDNREFVGHFTLYR